jgi:hypothetical protein
VQVGPHRVVGARRVPADRVGVAERDALAVGEERRALEVVKRGQLRLVCDLRRFLLPSGPDGALIASVVAAERL